MLDEKKEIIRLASELAVIGTTVNYSIAYDSSYVEMFENGEPREYKVSISYNCDPLNPKFKLINEDEGSFIEIKGASRMLNEHQWKDRLIDDIKTTQALASSMDKEWMNLIEELLIQSYKVEAKGDRNGKISRVSMEKERTYIELIPNPDGFNIKFISNGNYIMHSAYDPRVLMSLIAVQDSLSNMQTGNKD